MLVFRTNAANKNKNTGLSHRRHLISQNRHIENYRCIFVFMDQVEIFKALANKTRIQILTWLKDPTKHFPAHEKNCENLGVCVGLIQQKAGLTQSTISAYLSILQRAGFVTATRMGQWTYYKRNETAFEKLGHLIASEL